MKNIKEIVAENLIALRKKKDWTQEEVAKKLNYSDNTVSRWERAEICPSLESLQSIAELYSVPLTFLVKENVIRQVENDVKTKKIKAFAWCTLSVSLVWLLAIIAFFVCKTSLSKIYWIFFVWAFPATFIVLFVFAFCWKKRTFHFIMLTLFIWTCLASFYLQFLTQNIWVVFLIGVPLQASWTIWCYLPLKYKKKQTNEK